MSFSSDPLGTLFDPEMLRSSLSAAGGGAIGSVAYTAAVEFAKWKSKDGTTKYLFDKPWKRLLGAAVLGFGGGRALWEVSEDMAKGHVGALAGQMAVEVYDMLTKKSAAQLVKEVATATGAGTQGLFGVNGMLHGLSAATEVEESRSAQGRELANLDVEDTTGAMLY